MKRTIVYLLALPLALSLLAGCVGATTITEQPGNYVYGLNEDIAVVDIETRETFGVLAVTGVEVLRDEPFEVQEQDGEDEDGKPAYKTVTYSQIIQIFYTYSGEKKLNSGNFAVWDSVHVIGKNPAALEPKPEYTPAEKPGQSSLVVALQAPGGPLEVTFTYNVLQIRPTARIKIEL